MLLEEPLPLETAGESPSFKLEPMETERSPGPRLQELLDPSPQRDSQAVKERALSAPWLSLFPPEGNVEDKDMTGTQLPESLEDMAMYISQEWDHQDPSKRALSRYMVQDSYENSGTLGKSFSFWDDIYDQTILLLGHTHLLDMSSEFCQ